MVVVFPTPPFWFAIAITRGSSRGAGRAPSRSALASERMVGVLIWTAGSGGALGTAEAYLDSTTRSDTVESTTKGVGSAARTTGGSLVTGWGVINGGGSTATGGGVGTCAGAGVGAGVGVRAGTEAGTGADASAGAEAGARDPGGNEGGRPLRIPPETGAPGQRGAAVRPRAGLGGLGSAAVGGVGEAGGSGGGEGGMGFTTISGSAGAAFSAGGVSPRSRRRIRIRQYFRFDAP